MSVQNMSATTSAAAAVVALSALLVDSIYLTLIPAHIAMLTVITYWMSQRSPKALVLFGALFFASLAYLLIVNLIVPLGDRFFNESIKYIILMLFIISVMEFPKFARSALFYLSLFIPSALLIYVMFSADSLVYGGRLGVAISDSDQDAMISANTIGFALNICIITIVCHKNKIFYLFIPAIFYLEFLTFSRGTFLSLSIIATTYFFKIKKFRYAVFVSLLSLPIFLDFNVEYLNNYLRLDDTTGSGRSIIYEILIERMIANPVTLIFGHGPGSINFEIYSGKTLISAHSGYFELLYTFGIIGLFVWIWFFWNALNNLRNLSLDSALYAALLAAYAISEDLNGSHNLLLIGLILGVFLNDLKRVHQSRRASIAGT